MRIHSDCKISLQLFHKFPTPKHQEIRPDRPCYNGSLSTPPNTHKIRRKQIENQREARQQRETVRAQKKKAFTSSTIKYQFKNSLNTLVAPTGIEPVYHA